MMKIKSVSCTQFAGLRDKQLSFEPGINVVCGKNESGKSSLVNLISRTLFQSTKLDMRRDKEFSQLYFPAGKPGGLIGDFIDGKVSLEDESGVYTVSKEWGADARSTLSTPEGVIRDQKRIDEILRELLGYGEGVYAEMLLSNQRNSDEVLRSLLDSGDRTAAKQELTEAVTRAFAQTDGLSMDAIAQAIDKKINELAGSHWDIERSQPVRKAGRWAQGVGEVLKAYYAVEDARMLRDSMNALENSADSAASKFSELDAAAADAKKKYEDFSAFASQLALRKTRNDAVSRLEKELSAYMAVLQEWPELNAQLEKARELETEKNARLVLDKLNAAEALAKSLQEAEDALDSAQSPDKGEINAVIKSERSVAALENKLCGINLTAQLKMLNGHEVKISVLRTGEEIPPDSAVNITEAVKINVPGVMEMTLNPTNVDAEAVSKQIKEEKATAAAVLSKYSAASVADLEAMADRYAELQRNAEKLHLRLGAQLGGDSLDALREAAKSITAEPRAIDDIIRDVRSLTANGDISRLVAEKETLISRNVQTYGSIDALKARAFDTSMELEKMKSGLDDADGIPAEYTCILDPEAHLAALKNDAELCAKRREEALTEKMTALSRLETQREQLKLLPEDAVRKAQDQFEGLQELLGHWLHIKAVFEQQRSALDDDPMEGLAANFARYLDIISAGGVTTVFPEKDKLAMNIVSRNRTLDYAKLSEGTKDTVSLAFRLAVLDHLFPNGGGVAVFDDPFADMDEERTAQSCALIRDFARRHQVIFLTCHEENCEKLGGNIINM